MKKFINNILEGFEFSGLQDFTLSMFPELKYKLMFVTFSFSFIVSAVKVVFGITHLSLIALIVVMVLEITTGVIASKFRNEKFESKKLSRFTIKMACYLVLITIPHLLSTDFENRGNNLVSNLFSWLHTFLIIQIAIENIISVLENISVIQGKEKGAWIQSIKNKFGIK